MKYKVIVYYDNMEDSEHVFNDKNEAINELHRLRGVKYRNSKKYTVEDVTECLSIAYEEIKNRKGKMINGTFVKEEDL